MNTRNRASVGIEFDSCSIRAVRAMIESVDGVIGYEVLGMEQLTGNFASELDLCQGLRQIANAVGIRSKDLVLTCVSGKQTAVIEVPFRRLSPDEMATALRFELRKTLPFDANNSFLSYKFLPSIKPDSATVQVLVAIAAYGLITDHLRVLDSAGIHVDVVDLLPLALSNAAHIFGESTGTDPTVLLHIGPDYSTVVIKSAEEAFFTRTIHFNARELFGSVPAESLSATQIVERLESLADEVLKTAAYYETTYRGTIHQTLVMMGGYAARKEVQAVMRDRTRYQVKAGGNIKCKESPRPGLFEIAAALALRGE